MYLLFVRFALFLYSMYLVNCLVLDIFSTEKKVVLFLRSCRNLYCIKLPNFLITLNLTSSCRTVVGFIFTYAISAYHH